MRKRLTFSSFPAPESDMMKMMKMTNVIITTSTLHTLEGGCGSTCIFRFEIASKRYRGRKMGEKVTIK